MELEDLRRENSEMAKELHRYRELYSSKQEELETLSCGISERMEKQCNEKNVFIK
jgi:hypothetical protein